MKVLVCGSTGFVGRAVAGALKARGHQVLGASRSGAGSLRVDFMAPVAPEAWAQRLRELQVDAVVNCVGLLMARGGQSFERVHAAGPIELFRGAALAGVARVVQVSALGADRGPSPYLRTKHEADECLLALPLAGTVLRPSLLYGPGCPSSALFATLAALPVVALPGGGAQPLQPLHVYELAEIVARCLERDEASIGAFELGGAAPLSYREMLAVYRDAQGLGDALWVPVPMALMQAGARLAEALPQSVFCRETVALLARGNVPAHNAAARLLGRAPTGLAAGLAISPPQPWLSLRAELSPALDATLRGALAATWLWAAVASLWWPPHAGVLAVVAGGLLNGALGLAVLLKPGPRTCALQAVAIVGWAMLDHGISPMRDLPLLALVLLLWVAVPPPARARAVRRPSKGVARA